LGEHPVLTFPRVALLFLCLLVPASLFAQTSEPGAPPSNVRLHLGPLFLNPTVGLTNIGIDDNVFNQPDSANPQSDFTMTFVPAADVWLRFGPTWIGSSVREDLVYYKTYASERSANTNVRLNWTIPLNRLVLVPGMTYLNTKERPGYEIDTRAHRTELGYNGTVELRVASKTYVGVRGDRRTVDYDQNATFDGTNLHDELNHKSTTGAVTVRYEATPLTSITFDASTEQDRFDLSPDRDSDSTEFHAGFRFDPAALIKGTATFGYRDFRPISGAVPGYKGSTVAVDISYVPEGGTRLTLTVARDVQYSYDVNQPYYLQTGATGSISQQIFGPVDVVGRIGGQRLDYRDRAGAVVPEPGRTDRIMSYGGGVGYHMGQDLRVGFNVDWQQRTSVVDSKQYNNLRYGIAVTYGT
jgi:hypothetical protein